jgi:DNA-directed RNA polymerase sigma subunit (sigma70/sigma32)
MYQAQKEKTAMRLLLINAGRLTREIGKLPEEQRKVIRMRFGIGKNSDHTLDEVGKDFHATREQIRDLENLAIETLLETCGLLAKRIVEEAEKGRRQMTPEEKLLEAIFGKRV